MFDANELRSLATDDQYSTVQVGSKELLSLLDECVRLRKLATCGCGDIFTEHDPGTCGNCIVGQDRTAEVERLRKENGKLRHRTLEMFDKPRRPRQWKMHVIDAGECEDEDFPVIARLGCARCGSETAWLQFVTVTEARRGVPCPKCNGMGPNV